MPADLTPEERAEWRQEADRTLVRLLSDADSRTVADRILRLLDALDAAEAYRTTPELALELARVAQERAAAAEAERDQAHARGVAEERARVVALVSDAHVIIGDTCPGQTVWLDLAEAYLRGDHDPDTAPAGGSDV